MWTFEEARAIINKLEGVSKLTGWHFALAGGVLRNGSSDHDLDIIAYPRTSTKADRWKLRYWLGHFMFWRWRVDVKEMHKHWKAKGSKDRKHVEVWQTADNKRVDLFILGDNPGWFGEK